MQVTKAEIDSLRTAFLQDLETKGVDSIHPKDLDRIKTSDHWLERFLKHNEKNQQMSLEMMWESVKWRKEFKTNEITEDNIKKDIIVTGAFFPYGRDKDGSTLLVFKCIKHKKGQVDMEDLKRCIIYWFERVDREENGNPVSLFFDMEGCGLANMDMELTKYLIGLFKTYYPYFLNYILIFEMPWVLSAAFKIIKSWLPEKAIEKIKFVSKKDIKNFVPLDQALVCWGGTSNYQFSFIPEEKTPLKELTNNNKKVHFMDGALMSDSANNGGDRENDGDALKVHPDEALTFYRDGRKMFSTFEIENVDPSVSLIFKVKSTAPHKFGVKPVTGVLAPRDKVLVTVSLICGYTMLFEKFMVVGVEMKPEETFDNAPNIWKDRIGTRKHYQVKMRCVQPEINGSGDAPPVRANRPHNRYWFLTLAAVVVIVLIAHFFNPLVSELPDLNPSHKEFLK